VASQSPKAAEVMSSEPVPSLLEWSGGPAAIKRLINAFYDRVEHDDVLNALFPSGVSTAHRDHVVAWWVEVFGGPATYTEKHGGHAHMVDKHRSLAITAEQRFRFASTMSLAADDAELPADPEFRAAFVGYVEWGTRLAFYFSGPGSNEPLPDTSPTPRWGWGDKPPYRP
jgi:hemoglobin